MTTFWMPPMERVLELEEAHGVTGYMDEEPIIGAGDIAKTEHLIHELCHGALLFEDGFENEKHLSEAIPNALDELHKKMPDKSPRHQNELETFSVESLVVGRLHLPIHPSDIEAALAIQVAQVLPDDFVQRFREAKDTGHVQEAADRVCAILAPDGPARRPRYAEGAVFWRRTEDDFEIVVYPMLMGNARLCIGEPDDGAMLNAWCYQTDKRQSGLQKAVLGGAIWNGEGDDPPGGWYRNPQTGRRRPDGDPKKEFQAW